MSELIERRLADLTAEIAYVGGVLGGSMPESLAKRRERIAKDCLVGLLAADAEGQSHSRQVPNALSPHETAVLACELADALIAVLDEPASATQARREERAAQAVRNAEYLAHRYEVTP